MFKFSFFKNVKAEYIQELKDYLKDRRNDFEASILNVKNFGDLTNNMQKLREYSLTFIFSSTLDIHGEFKSVKRYSQFNGTIRNLNTMVTIYGKYAEFKKVEDKRILAVVSTFNDEDIISQVIDFLISQRLDILIIDNWSDDETLEIVQEKIQKNPGRIFLKKFPASGPIDTFQWADLLDYKVNNEISRNYEWLIHYDSDEIRISPWLGRDLRESISFVDSLGFNAIDFTVIDFRPTKDGFNRDNDPQKFFQYFEFGKRPGHFLQVKAWKNYGQYVDIRTHFGHDVLFENKKVYPLKFLLKHYPLRSSKYSKKKIFEDRKPRYLEELRKKGIDRAYDQHKKSDDFLWDTEDLIEYGNNEFFQKRYLLEWLTGTGIRD